VRRRAVLSKRVGNLLAVLTGFVAFGVSVVLLWNRLVSWTDLAILSVMYLPAAFGVTVGYHRLFAHRAFETHRPIRLLFAVLGSMAVQGPLLEWVSDHRCHHAHADLEGDPHSPHVGHGGGVTGALKGLWHAHVGWVFRTQGQSDPARYAPDLLQDRGLVAIDRYAGVFVGLTLAIPFGLGYVLTGTTRGAWTALLWGGLVRTFFIHHAAFSVNSICHFFGVRRFDVPDCSRNVSWLALPTLGESWHNNHHAFQRSAAHGLRRWEMDPSAWLIGLLERLGLAWNVVRVPMAQQEPRLLATPRA